MPACPLIRVFVPVREEGTRWRSLLQAIQDQKMFLVLRPIVDDLAVHLYPCMRIDWFWAVPNDELGAHTATPQKPRGNSRSLQAMHSFHVPHARLFDRSTRVSNGGVARLSRRHRPAPDERVHALEAAE